MTTTADQAQRRLDRAHTHYLAAQRRLDSALTQRGQAWTAAHRNCPHSETAYTCHAPGCTQGHRYNQADEAVHHAQQAHDDALLEWSTRFDDWTLTALP